jgi:hypothetical protein
MDIDTIAVSFVVLPLAFIDVSVGMPELSAPIGFVFSPFTLVFCIIRPYLNTRSVSHFIKQVSFIDCTIFKCKFFDKLKSLSQCFLLKLNQILVFGFKQLRNLARLVNMMSISDIVL